MPFIRVDHSRFESAAKQLESYIDYAKSRMKDANTSVNNLIQTGWQGDDSISFRNRWNLVDSKESVYYKMMKSLKSYADYLRYASNAYKQAQINAVNRANRLR